MITRSGNPVAELLPLNRRRMTTSALVERRRLLPHVDVDALRSDIDGSIDAAL